MKILNAILYTAVAMLVITCFAVFGWVYLLVELAWEA